MSFSTIEKDAYVIFHSVMNEKPDNPTGNPWGLPKGKHRVGGKTVEVFSPEDYQ